VQTVGYQIEKEDSTDRLGRNSSSGSGANAGGVIVREISEERQLQQEVSEERQDVFDDEVVRSRTRENIQVYEGSLTGMPPLLQGGAYLMALGGVLFTLLYPAFYEEDHRRLGAAPSDSGGTPTLEEGHAIITAISYSTLAAGLLALIVSMLKQPLLLGYILAGFCVGPEILNLVEDHSDIKTIADLGLVLLLFMIGLELDLHELSKMGKVVLVTGSLQFPICAGLHLGIFNLFSAMGLNFGSGDYAVLYASFCTGISSTMIVVKLLSEKMETDTTAGRLTISILIFQDIWAIVMLAIQPNMADPKITGLLGTFGFMAILIVVAFSYSKYVLPAVFMKASSSPELMLILALAWCFFVCAVAILSFVGLSMELAALIAGVSMATFPYNAELNGKVKYIRDYFITLFFVAVGMQIPMPTLEAVSTAVVICIVVLMVRWIGIFSVAYMLGGGSRLSILATVNLSESSEFGIVLCTIGIQPDKSTGKPHIGQDTFTIIIWTFAILAIAASYFIGYNHTIHHFLIHKVARRLPCERCKHAGMDAEGHDDDDGHEERDIIILGFHKIAAAMIAEFEHRCPMILWRLHVIDTNENLRDQLAKKNVTFSYGDITHADVLEHAHHGEADLVLLTVPESSLQAGVTNLRLLEVARQVWPKCHIIVIADSPKMIKELYNKGANYVVATKKLSAERIADMLTDHYSDGLAGGELRHHLEYHRDNEAVWNPKLITLH
jgi:Kef-type K+ transport system membrane component KefB